MMESQYPDGESALRAGDEAQVRVRGQGIASEHQELVVEAVELANLRAGEVVVLESTQLRAAPVEGSELRRHIA
jgi:hypothetical protein